MIKPSLSIVVAVRGESKNLADIRRSFLHAGPDVEVIYVLSGRVLPRFIAREHDVVLESPESSLVPHLWRDGIAAARSPKVALTTSQFVPPPGWVVAAKSVDLERWAGVGGPIANDPAVNPTRWAVFFLRYMAFAHPQAASEVPEIAADNAVYRLSEIAKHPDLLQRGFWEPSFHQRFRNAGQALFMDPALLTIHRGQDTVMDFCRRRFQHALEFGKARAIAVPLSRRIGYVVMVPLVPLVLLFRIVRRVVRQPRYVGPLLVSSPWLLLFCLAWSIGEGSGYLSALFRRREASQAGSLS